MKKGSNTVKAVYELVKPLAEELKLDIWDVRFVKEGGSMILRIIIDKPDGVSVDDCERLSRPLDKKLDEADLIDQSYCLEVSSAGLERELTRPEHFEKLKGQKIVVRLIRAYNGEREFTGELDGLENGELTISAKEGKLRFKLDETAFVRQYFEF